MGRYNIGFIGAGSIARAHAYSLSALKFYYDDAPGINLCAVASAHEESRGNFAGKYGFARAVGTEEFFSDREINVVFILGPNNTHFGHLKLALQMPAVDHIYLEKPVCSSLDEEDAINRLLSTLKPEVKIQVGFQYLQTPAIREALSFWKSGKLGNPIHFDLKYYHGDYLQTQYRGKRKSRLTPAPDGGVMADLGSHGLSLLAAFFNADLKIMDAVQSGKFDDVPQGSDLFSSVVLYDACTGAVGNLSASRISSGTGDLIRLEIYAEKGSLVYSSEYPDCFMYFLEETGEWVKKPVGSNYPAITSFPSGHVPAGWLRALVHAHYIFLTGDARGSFVPDLRHGLAVQRLVRETADNLKLFREKIRI